jgi:hypothetical protein
MVEQQGWMYLLTGLIMLPEASLDSPGTLPPLVRTAIGLEFEDRPAEPES